MMVNFNKAAAQFDRHFYSTQRKLVISQSYSNYVYAKNSIRFRVEADSKVDFAIKAEFEPNYAKSNSIIILRT